MQDDERSDDKPRPLDGIRVMELGFATNKGRIEQRAAIDEAIAAWTRTLPSADVVSRLESVGVPAGPIQNARELRDDPHFQARGQFESVQVDGRSLLLPALGPLLRYTPGRTQWPGGALGRHTQEILAELGLEP